MNASPWRSESDRPVPHRFFLSNPDNRGVSWVRFRISGC